MKNFQIIKKSLLLGLTISLTVSCTDLREEALDGVIQSSEQGGVVNTSSFLSSAYEGLRTFQDQGQTFAMGEMSSDALAGPTRGGDWDDNGAWRQLHTHTWDPVHVQVKNTWNSLLSNVYNCNQVIYNSNVANEITEARFLRAFFYYYAVDLYGSVPYRLKGSDPKADALVYTRTEATNFIISELETIMADLPVRTANNPAKVSKDAAHFLLAKIYLNKAVFTSTDPSNVPASSFNSGDMTKVVTNVEAMTNSLASNYWDNFSPNNNNSNELVFTSQNTRGGGGGNMQSRWRMSAHYNQTPGGWNGFSTVAEYYNKFNPNDLRIKNSDPTIIADFGNPAGFQIGQQYAPGGTTPLKDRKNNNLIFTSALTLITKGKTLETAGIRGMKYIPDVANIGSPENDYVLMRYSDALLMKAEAIVRGGSGSVSTIMADIAARTGQAASTATLDGIYAERGRELWWEGWRRNDMIRFGKFLDQRGLKPYASDKKFALYPIPAGAMLNPNFTQNPGY
jgi:starch-binding outer membrane protein, SusD/RagB family